MLNLYDTATQSVKPLALRQPGSVSIYLCGPTVYGPPHLGHGRATLVYDILRRYLTWTGLSVRLVSNITDIDDKIIDRALSQGGSLQYPEVGGLGTNGREYYARATVSF